MSCYQRGLEKRKIIPEYRKEYGMEVEESYEETSSMSPKGQMEHEKRLRREIANSNERRRMQSINAGFDSLKTIIPHNEGEKLSKAAILQQTAEYVTSLEAEKTRLLTQNSQLKRLLAEMGHNAADSDTSSQGSPPPKRKKRDTESSDEGIGLRDSEFEDQGMDDLKRERQDLRMQLERERQLRLVLEEETRFLKAQLQYPAQRLRQEPPHSPPAAAPQPDKPRYFVERPATLERQPTQMETETTEQKPVVAVAVAPVVTAPVPSIAAPRISSMSRRNLETIVEAIRHLEGDSMLFDGKSEDCDSDKDCLISSGDEDEVKSQYSGCASPPHSDSGMLEVRVQATTDKYPHLLQPTRPASSSIPPPPAFMQHRQPVIVVNVP